MPQHTQNNLRYFEVETSLFRRLKKGQLKSEHIQPKLLEKWISTLEIKLARKKEIKTTRQKRDKKYNDWRKAFNIFQQKWESFLDTNHSIENYEGVYENARNNLAEEGKAREFVRHPEWYETMKQQGFESAINWAIFNAANEFDIKKGGKFNVVSYWKIRGIITKISRGRAVAKKNETKAGALHPMVYEHEPEGDMLKAQYISAVGSALENISKQDRDILTDKYVLEISAKELAMKAGVTPAGIYNRLVTARHSLQNQILESLQLPTPYKADVKEQVVELLSH